MEHNDSARLFLFQADFRVLAAGIKPQTIFVINIFAGVCSNGIRGYHPWLINDFIVLLMDVYFLCCAAHSPDAGKCVLDESTLMRLIYGIFRFQDEKFDSSSPKSFNPNYSVMLLLNFFPI